MSELPFTLDQLKIVKAISDEGSFKQASKKLYISQPAVSLQIQNLEKKLNVALYNRNKKKIELTEAGELLLRYAIRILDLCEETSLAIQDLENLQDGNLLVGASQTTGTYLMPRVIGLFRQRYSHINIQLHIYSTRKIAWAVVNGELDIAVIGGEVPEELVNVLEITPYAEDELVLILPKSHPLSSFKKIQKEDLYQLKYIVLDTQSTIRGVIDNVLNENGIDSSRFKIEMELNSIEAIKNAVQSGLGAAFVSISAITKELELGIIHQAQIENIKIRRVLSILTNPNRYPSKALESFTQEILTLFLK